MVARKSQWGLLAALLITVGAGISVSRRSSADIADNAPSNALAEITVTAQKRSEDLQKVAGSIAVLTGDELSAEGAGSFQDYIASVPSVSYAGKSPGDQVFAIRGVSDTIQTDGNTAKTVGVYLDDTVVSNNWSSPDLRVFDLDRVEVLRGPQGTLYGSDAIGGVIRLITKKADTKNFEATAGVDISSTEHGGTNFTTNAMVNLPLQPGVWGLRLVGYDTQNSGFINNFTTGEKRVNDEKTRGGRVSLAFTPIDALSIVGNVVYQDMRLGERSLVQTWPPVGDLTYGYPTPGLLDFTYDHLNLTVNYDAGFADLSSSTTYSIYKRNDIEDFTDTLTAILGTVYPSSGHIRNDTKSGTEEIRLVSKLGSPFDWILGGYYFHLTDKPSEFDTTQGLETLLQQFGLAGSPLDLGNNVIYSSVGSSSQTEYAAFGDLTYHLTNQLSATAGLRWSHYNLEKQRTDAGFAFGNPAYAYGIDTSANKVQSRFRIAYQATDDLLVYTTAAQGYRIGGINPVTPSTVTDPGYPKTFQPDSLWSYEIGAKSAWLEHRLTLNGAVFYTLWKDVQLEQVLPDGFTFVGNGGAAHTRGIELELAARPISGLELSLGATELNAQLDRDVPALNAVKGDPLPGVAKFNGSASVQFSLPLDTLNTVYWRLDGHYVSKMHHNFGESDDASGDYGLANGRVGLRHAKWDFTAYVDNLADRRANFYSNVLSNPATDFYVKYEAVARPRTSGLKVQYTW